MTDDANWSEKLWGGGALKWGHGPPPPPPFFPSLAALLLLQISKPPQQLCCPRSGDTTTCRVPWEIPLSIHHFSASPHGEWPVVV